MRGIASMEKLVTPRSASACASSVSTSGWRKRDERLAVAQRADLAVVGLRDLRDEVGLGVELVGRDDLRAGLLVGGVGERGRLARARARRAPRRPTGEPRARRPGTSATRRSPGVGLLGHADFMLARSLSCAGL